MNSAHAPILSQGAAVPEEHPTEHSMCPMQQLHQPTEAPRWQQWIREIFGCLVQPLYARIHVVIEMHRHRNRGGQGAMAPPKIQCTKCVNNLICGHDDSEKILAPQSRNCSYAYEMYLRATSIWLQNCVLQ